jgi:hypothetical protein
MTNLLITPTIHMNGTSRAALVEQYVTALDAVDAAIAALMAATPNGRDYYPQGVEAITTALVEHQARIDRLATTRGELSEIAERIGAYV